MSVPSPISFQTISLDPSYYTLPSCTLYCIMHCLIVPRTVLLFVAEKGFVATSKDKAELFANLSTSVRHKMSPTPIDRIPYAISQMLYLLRLLS